MVASVRLQLTKDGCGEEFGGLAPFHFQVEQQTQECRDLAALALHKDHAPNCPPTCVFFHEPIF